MQIALPDVILFCILMGLGILIELHTRELKKHTDVLLIHGDAINQLQKIETVRQGGQK